MDYSQGTAANALNQYSLAGQQAGNPAPPRTIASAVGRIDGLNDRLVKVREMLSNISDQIGGPRPMADAAKGGTMATQSPSAVNRLNDSAEHAHEYLSEIENLLNSIGRALG